MPKPPVCLGCPLYGEEGPIFSEGPRTAQLVILSGAPGPMEIKDSRPLVQGSDTLNRTFGKVGLSRAGSYVTNVVKCKVKTGSPIPPGALRHCKKAFLDEELKTLSPKVILTLGQESFNSLASPKHVALVHVRQAAKKDPSYWLVGAPYHHPDGYVIVPAVHPAFVARTGFAMGPKFDNQCGQAARVLDFGAPTILDVRYVYNPSNVEVVEYVDHMLGQPSGGCDIETSYKSIEEDEVAPEEETTKITEIGLAAGIRDYMSIKPDQFHLLTALFHPESARPPLRMWCYGAQTEWHFLGHLFEGTPGVKWADAMLAFHLLWSDEKSKDLGTCMAMCTQWGYHKNLEHRDPLWYNVLDTIGCLEAGENMYAELGRLPIDATNLFWNLSDIVQDLLTWQHMGAPYDQSLSDRYELQVGRALDVLITFWRGKFPMVDHASPKQLISLFNTLGFKAPLKLRKKKDGTTHKTPSVDEEALEGFAKKGSAVAKLLLQMRQLKKSDEFCNLAERDRLRCRAKIHGQAGGRIQTVDRNVQQIPEVLLQSPTSPGIMPRNCVIPEHEDDIIVAADFSQIEFWLYAYFSKCEKLLAVKEKGEYLYGDFYESIWNEPFFLAGQPRKKEFRDDAGTPPWKLLVAKSWPLGFIYGRGVPGVEGLPISPARAKTIRTDFHSAYPEIGRYHNDLMFEATKRGFLQTPFGRMRRFANPQVMRNSLLAFPGQSTAPDILIQKVILGAGRAVASLFGPRSRLYFTVHDSGIFNIHGGRKDPALGLQAVQYIKQTLESPIPELDGFIIPTEVKIGPSWGQVMSTEKYAKIATSTA